MNTRIIPLLAVLAALTATGCADDRMSLEPYAICAMPESCIFSGGKCDAIYIGAIGYASGAGSSWLQFGVELRNQAPNNADEGTLRVNSNDAHVTGLRLEIDGPTSGTLSMDVGNQTVPAGLGSVVWTYVLPPATATGAYVVKVVYIGYYDNGRTFETPGFPIAVNVDAAALGYGCSGTDVIVCGNSQQSVIACGAP
jgi:hypothetical protein